MSIPRRQSTMPVERESEPAGVTPAMYKEMFASCISYEIISEAKDGKGLFQRPGKTQRDMIGRFYLLLDSLSNITWYPKKTTLQDAFKLTDEHYKYGLTEKVEGSKGERIRAEAYAIKSMFLDITNTAKHMKTGERLPEALQKLVVKFKTKKDNFLSTVLQSPFLQRRCLKQSL